MIEPLLEAVRKTPKLQTPKDFFALRAGHANIKKQSILSELVLVAREEEHGEWKLDNKPYLFAPQFQTFVGSCLPMGIGPHRPAMVAAIKRWANDEWEVVACYLDMKYPQLLWREKNPRWVTGERSGSSQKKAG